MKVAKYTSELRVLKQGEHTIEFYSPREVQDKFCKRAYDIVERTGEYDLKECDRCTAKCMSYETNQPRKGY